MIPNCLSLSSLKIPNWLSYIHYNYNQYTVTDSLCYCVYFYYFIFWLVTVIKSSGLNMTLSFLFLIYYTQIIILFWLLLRFGCIVLLLDYLNIFFLLIIKVNLDVGFRPFPSVPKWSAKLTQLLISRRALLSRAQRN